MRSLSLLSAAALLGCSHAPAEAQAPACTAIPDTTTLVEIGTFSNMRYTEEHAYGYSVMLWRAGTCVIGFFLSSAGLAGDTPIGELQNVAYDSVTSKLSFSAKLTMGLVSFKGSNGNEVSRDLYSFDGLFRAGSMKGVVTHATQNNPNATPDREDVTLVPKPDESAFMKGPATVGAWRAEWQPILRARGPKW